MNKKFSQKSFKQGEAQELCILVQLSHCADLRQFKENLAKAFLEFMEFLSLFVNFPELFFSLNFFF